MVRREKLMKVARAVPYRHVQWGKRRRVRGKYVVAVLDKRGKKVGDVPWSPTVRREMRALQSILEGRPTKRAVRELGYGVPGWRLESVDAETGEPTFARTVWKGRVMVGEHGRRAPKKRYLGRAYEAIDPDSWWGLLARATKAVPDPTRAYVGIRVWGRGRDGEERTFAYPPQYKLSDMLDARMLRSLLFLGLSGMGRGGRGGSGEGLTATRVDLTILVLLEGISHAPALF